MAVRIAPGLRFRASANLVSAQGAWIIWVVTASTSVVMVLASLRCGLVALSDTDHLTRYRPTNLSFYVDQTPVILKFAF